MTADDSENDVQKPDAAGPATSPAASASGGPDASPPGSAAGAVERLGATPAGDETALGETAAGDTAQGEIPHRRRRRRRRRHPRQESSASAPTGGEGEAQAETAAPRAMGANTLTLPPRPRRVPEPIAAGGEFTLPNAAPSGEGRRRRRRRRRKIPGAGETTAAEPMSAAEAGTSGDASSERRPRRFPRRPRAGRSGAGGEHQGVFGEGGREGRHNDRGERPQRGRRDRQGPRDREGPREGAPGEGREARDRRGPRPPGKFGGKFAGKGGKGGPRHESARKGPEPKLYTLESVVDRGFEELPDPENEGQTRRVEWSIVKRTVADQRAAKAVSAQYVLKRDGAETDFANLAAARAAVNKTIVHPEKLTRAKADYPTTKK